MNALKRAGIWSGSVFLATASFVQASDPALVQTIVFAEGDVIFGVGNVSTISNLAINRSGHTQIEVDTDNPDTDADSALVANGFPFLQEGMLISGPSGPNPAIDSFDSVNLNDTGNSAFNFFLSGTNNSNDNSAVFFNSSMLLQEGQVASAAELSPNTPFIGFFEVKINNADQLLLLATVDDAAIASTVDQALITLDTLGNQSVRWKEGDLAPGLGGAQITSFSTGPHSFDWNDQGDAMFFADTDADSSQDGVIYLNDQILAREGSPAPVTGRSWSTLSSPELALNNQADTVFSGSMDGDSADNVVIVRNGEVFVREGDSLPDIAPFQLTGFGTGPLFIADRDTAADEDPDIVWYGTWDNPDSDRDSGLFVNHRLVLAEGVDTVAGAIVDTIRGIQDGFASSDDGRYLLIEVELDGIGDAVVRIDRGPWQNLGGGVGGTLAAPRLRGTGTLVAGVPISIDLSGAPSNELAALFIGFARVDLPFLGGVLGPAPDVVLFLPTDGNGELFASANVQCGPAAWFGNLFPSVRPRSCGTEGVCRLEHDLWHRSMTVMRLYD